MKRATILRTVFGKKGVMMMLKLTRDFWCDEHGFLVSTELVLIATIGVLGLIAGLSCLSTAVVNELQDVGYAVRSMNQSYSFGGFRGCKSWVPGSSFFNQNYQTVAVNDVGCDIGLNAGPCATPALTGPVILDPNGVIVPGAGSTTVGPCLNQDCVKVPGTPVGPVVPMPDATLPVTPAPMPPPAR